MPRRKPSQSNPVKPRRTLLLDTIEDRILCDATIRGTVYADANGNGTFDAGADGGIGNAQVQLINAANGTVIATATTNTSGAYVFNNVPNNLTVHIREVQSNVFEDRSETVGTSNGNGGGGTLSPVNFPNDIRNVSTGTNNQTLSGYNFGDVTASASAVFSVGDSGGAGGGDDIFVVHSDSENRSYTVGIGTGTTNIEAISYDPEFKVLYALNEESSTVGRLGTIDPNRGVFIPKASAIGSGTGDVDADGANDDVVVMHDLDGLSFNPFSGALYAAVRREGAPDLLVQINPSTGTLVSGAFTVNGAPADYVVVPPLAAFPTLNDIDDISFDPTDGQLYGIVNNGGTNDRIAKINPATGQLTDIGLMRDASNNPIGDMEGFGFTPNGVLRGSTGANSTPGNSNRVWIIDKTTGITSNGQTLGPTASDTEGIAANVSGTNVISGTVFLDVNVSTTLNGGDVRQAGATVNLYRDLGTIGVRDAADIFLASTTTDANGNYDFTFVADGNFVLDIDTTSLPSDAFLTTDNLEAASFATFGNNDANNNFGFIRQGNISGTVYQDNNNDGLINGADAGISNVSVRLTGTDVFGNNVDITTITGPTGAYSFANVMPSNGAGYTVTELPPQPANTLDGKETIGTGTNGTQGSDLFTGLVLLTTGSAGTGYNFGEIPPANVSGRVFDDRNNNGLIESGEDGIGNVPIHLTGINDLGQSVDLNTITAADGTYSFSNLRPGTYTVVEVAQPSGFLDGKEAAGAFGGSIAVNEQIGSFALPSGGSGTDYNFGELTPSSLSGFVYIDANNNGVFEGSETGVVGASVTLTGIDDLGQGVTIVGATGPGGAYSFTGLRPGTYTISETTPADLLDGKDTIGSPGGSASDDVFGNIVLAPATSGANNNFGELAPASISGFVYRDLNNDGIRDGGENGVAGVAITLVGIDDLGQSVSLSMNTDGTGAYAFTNLRPGTYTVTEAQPGAFLDGKDTAGIPGGGIAGNDVINTITLVSGRDSVENNFGELPGTSISGFVYIDSDNDGIFDPGEQAQPDVSITLTGVDDLGNTVNITVLTQADGSYAFTGLRPSNAAGYTVTETQPGTLLDGKDTLGTLAGSAAVNDTFSGIVIDTDESGEQYNFGELRPSSLSGTVFDDRNNDGVLDPGENGIANADVLLTGIDDLGNAVNIPLTSGPDGTYSFSNLRPGTYVITETTPSGFLDGKDSIGTPGGSTANDVFANIVVAENTNGADNNFGELTPASLSGNVFIDSDNDGVFDASEIGIGSVSIALTGTDDLGNAVSLSTTTNADGSYSFNGLRPGTYTVTETQPSGFLDGKDAVGSLDGTLDNDAISTIAIAAADTGTNYNFGEVRASTLSGSVFIDANNDGIFDATETGIDNATVTLTGTDDLGNSVNISIVTDADGSYTFTGLRPGTYVITETQPVGSLDGKDLIGTPGGTTTEDVFSNIVVAENTVGTDNNFGELRPSSLSGTVFDDRNNNGVFEPGENGIANVSVVLTGIDDLGNAVNIPLTTNPDGTYSFTNLRPGTYAITETTPGDFLDGKDSIGTPGGSAANDVFSNIVVAENTEGADNNFGELTPASLSGNVFIDSDNDGVFDPVEAGIGDVTVSLTGTDDLGNSVSLSTTTNSDGSYSFTGLRPGAYAVTETQPPTFLDGKDAVGSLSGALGNDIISAVLIASADSGIDYNFGELRPSSLSGIVFDDRNNDGVLDPGESGIANAGVVLTGIDDLGNVVNVSLTTDPDGTYSFTNLRPGTYVLTETTPAGFLDGKDSIGTPGGSAANDVFSNIVVAENTEGTDNNFGELTPASLSGNVYVDLDRDGSRDPFENPLSNVSVTLTGTDDLGNPVSLTTTTAADGSYSFTGLRPSDANGYAITETTPAGYSDGAETIGTQSGILVAPDTIRTAPVTPGTTGSDNNFGELFDASLTKAIIGTSLPDTSGSNVTIGEVVTFRLTVTVPTGSLADFQILDLLPEGMRYLEGSATAFGTGVSGLDPSTGLALGDAQVSTSATIDDDAYTSGTDVFFKLGTLTTVATTGSITVEFSAVVVNGALNQIGTSLANTFAQRYDVTGDGVADDRPGTSNTVTSTVVEPVLSIDKAITSPAGPVKVGQTITYTLTLTHAADSGSTAWEATLTDAAPAGLQITGIVSSQLIGGAQEQSAAAITGGGAGLAGIYDIPLGGSVVITYEALVLDTAVLGSSLNNVANLTWTTLDGPSSDERGSGDSLLDQGRLNDYEVTDNATKQVDGGAAEFTLDKTILDDAFAEIGERLSYQIVLTVADGVINNLSLTDVLPAGFSLVSGSGVITAGTGVTITGSSLVDNAGGLSLSIGQVQSAADGMANTITITYQVDVLDSAANDAFAADPSRTNTATASYDPGTGPLTRTDTATATVIEPVITVDKTVANAPAKIAAGSTITFQVVIGHAANSTGNAYNVNFTDTLPAGFGNVQLVGVSGTAAVLPGAADFQITGNTISTLNPFDLPLGSAVVLTYSAQVQNTVTPGQALTNLATVAAVSTETSPSGNTRTSTSATNGSNYTSNDSTTVNVDAGIELVKDASVTTATIGDRVTYTLVIHVIEGTTPGLVLTDMLPAGPQFDPASLTVDFGAPGMSTGNTPTFTNGTLTVDFGDLSNPADGDSENDIITITYQTVIADDAANSNGASKQNIASVTYTGLSKPVTDDAIVTIVEPELNIVKTVDQTTPHLGDVVTYTLTISHTAESTSTAFDLILSDALPPGLALDVNSIALVSAPAGVSITSNTSADGGALALGLNMLPLGATATITYQATVSSDFAAIGGTFGGDDDSFTNTVNLTYDSKSGTPPDGQRTKTDSSSSTVTVVGADLSVTKDDGFTGVTPGQTVTYTIVVRNNGTDAATNVSIVDSLPISSVAFVSAPGGAFDASNGTVSFSIASLGVGETQTFTVTVTVNSSVAAGIDSMTNNVVVSHDEPDPTPNDNQDDDIDPITAAPDYTITKTDGVTSAKPGDTLTYTITVTNVGNQGGTGVMVSDTFVTGLFSSATASNGGVVNLAAGTVSWNLGTLAAGQSVSLTLTCVLNATFADITIPDGTTPGAIPDNNTIADTVTVTDDGTNGPDPTPQNNTATDLDDLVPQPELHIRKTDGVLTAQPGQFLTYTIVAENRGSQNSNGTIVTDLLPAGVTFVSASSSDPALTGSAKFVNGQVVWAFDQPFPAGASVRLTVQIQVNANVSAGTLTNVVSIRDDGRYGPDVVNRRDNRATDSDTIPERPAENKPAPFFFAYDSFNDFAHHSEPIFYTGLSSPDVYPEAILPVLPIYSGEADPGATLVVDLFNPNGELIGSETVMADTGGNWLATFPSSSLRDYPNSVRISQLAAPQATGETVGRNLRTYFTPAINPGHFFMEGGTIDAFITGRSAPLLGGLVLGNPLGLGNVKYAGELLPSQAVAAGH